MMVKNALEFELKKDTEAGYSKAVRIQYGALVADIHELGSRSANADWVSVPNPHQLPKLGSSP
jgi:hypothetical protein